MGAVLKRCSSSEYTQEELQTKVQTQAASMKKLQSDVDHLESQLDELKHEQKQMAKKINRCNRYDLLVDNRDETATTIMKSKLHIVYMDDNVEKLYICKLLEWIHDRVNGIENSQSCILLDRVLEPALGRSVPLM